MKISYNWLNDYIDLSDYREKIDDLCKLLTQAGLEVEGVTDQKTQFNHVVVGKLLSVEKHPDADKLTQCQVDTGDGSPRQIVCGAKNHKAGDYVIAALPGAVLPGDFAIKKSKIRGVESLGMLCSQKELGLSAEGEGIITLTSGKPGQPF
ncbi:phenylalanine--tRNA ligase subunit beta, partial [bacterium]|nr:phenylalanine--tRNA ligase subunit beta [bacterium]